MRNYFLLFMVSVLCLSCNKKNANKKIVIDKKQTQYVNEDFNPKLYYTTKDSVLLVAFEEDSIYVAREEFNDVVDKHSEFFTEYPRSPDITYLISAFDEQFSSEIGQDNYFMYYTYFLRQKYEIDNFEYHRNKLILIYKNLNNISHLLNGGGTGYGHMYARIYGYAEYSVYLYYLTRNDSTITYDISKQKSLFKQTLQQVVIDRLGVTFNTDIPTDKASLQDELFWLIDEIDSQITDSFYLAQTQDFYYRNYITW